MGVEISNKSPSSPILELAYTYTLPWLSRLGCGLVQSHHQHQVPWRLDHLDIMPLLCLQRMSTSLTGPRADLATRGT